MQDLGIFDKEKKHDLDLHQNYLLSLGSVALPICSEEMIQKRKVEKMTTKKMKKKSEKHLMLACECFDLMMVKEDRKDSSMLWKDAGFPNIIISSL